MFPTLIEFPEAWPLIGGKALHTYGALVALAFLVGLLWIRYESKRVGLPQQKMMDLFFYIIVSAIIGSRLLYVFTAVPHWWENPLVFFRVWEGGLIFYGGLIAAVLTAVFYTKRQKLPFLLVADTFVPGIALGHFFGRLGCFAAGCCYGKPAPAEGFFSVIFPQTKYSIAPYGEPLYPTQLFEAFGALVIFILLFFFRKFKKFDGEIFLLYIILYPIMRAVLETYRGSEVKGDLVGGVLSASQVISFVWIFVALILWTFVLRKKKV